MDLKRFSLGKEKEMNSNTITTHNKKLTSKRRMFLGSLDQLTLHLTSDDYSTFLDLKLGKGLGSDLCFLAINRSNDNTTIDTIRTKRLLLKCLFNT